MVQHALSDLAGKVFAVIGGGSGSGSAVAQGAAEHGASVVVLDSDFTAARAAAEGIGAAAVAAELDICNRTAVADALDGIASDRGHLDVVVCTPAINVRKTIL